MSETLIRRAFETRLKTYADANSLPVAWENKALNPQPEGAYLRATLLPAATTSQTLDRVHAQFLGIFQIDVCAPTGTGPAAAETIVAALRSLFTPTAPMTVSGLLVYIVDPLSRLPAIPDGDRFQITCSLPYRADT